MRYFLAPNNTLMIRGPAYCRLLNGEAEVLGAPLDRQRTLTINRDKQIPVEAATEADFEISMGNSSKIFEIEGSTIPASWAVAAEALAEMEKGKVILIGMTDVGKSTLSTYLTNKLLGKQLSFHIIDGDIGQADIGPPTTIAYSIPTTSISSLVELRPESIIFIGHTNASQVESKIIDGIRRLSNRARNSLTIINTDGWVLDSEAISYKIRMIAATEPDLVIGLATGGELQPILSSSHARALNIDTAKDVLARSRSDRRETRITGYRRFLEGARMRPISLRKVDLSTPVGFPSVHGPKARELNSLIVGLLDDEGYMLEIGVFMGFANDTARVYCRSVEHVHKIEVGYIKLLKDGTELGYFEPGNHPETTIL
jgi:polynucleotide 5'-hydroxyl-kinase GRC3/NOL9